MKIVKRIFLAGILLACAAQAQFDAGQISGFVRDNSGGSVASATVIATNADSREQHKVTTNTEGYYVVPQLLVGRYDLAVEASGFKKYTRTGVVINSQSKVSIDVELAIGAISEQITVESSAAQVQTDSASVGSLVDSKQIQNLTLNGRNPVYLAALTPGVVSGAGIGTFDPDSVSNGGFNINGGRADEYVVMVDGAVATRTRSSGSMLGAMDVDTVQEVQVITSSYSAEYGRSSAGQIRFVTKSGTRLLHGDVVENFRNSALDANTWTRNHSPLTPISSGAAPYRFNQYGYNLGGPVFIPKHFNTDRSKLFFFFAEEWTKRRYETTNTGIVPSQAMRNGNFSELLDATNPFFKKVRPITDSRNANAPFSGNIIPPSRLSQNGIALLNIYPQAVPGFLQGSSNWIGTKSTHSDLRKDTFKADYMINDREHLSVRGNYTPWHFNAPFEDTFGRMEEVWSRPNRIGAMSLISTITPTFINEINLSANSDGKGDIQFGDYCAACKRSAYGVNYTLLYPGTKIAPEKVPSLRMQGLTTLDAGPYPGSWSGFVYGLSDNVTKIAGTHSMKFGAYLEYSGQNDFIQGTTAGPGTTVNQNGDFTFNDTGNPATSGLSIANAALGNFDTYSEFGAKAFTPYVATALDLFAQDSWKVTSKLTLEYGVRWSLWPQWHSKWGNLSEFLPQYYNRATAPVIDPKGGFVVSGDQYNGIVLPGNGPPDAAGGRIPALNSGQFKSLYHGLPDGLSPTRWNVFQPRFGIAYAFSPKTVLRAGGGSFANRVAINRDTALGGNAPFQLQSSVVNGIVDTPGGATPRNFPFTQTIPDPVFKIPTAWEWNVMFQREVLWGTTVQVGYVGRRGLHNQRKRNINQLQAGTLQANPGINANALRPYLGMGVIGISENGGSSRYDALQVSVQHRYSSGIQVGVAYTFSRSLDDGSSLTDVLPNAYSAAGYYGRSDFDRPQVLVVNYTYSVPLFRNSSNKILQTALGGWELSGINQAQSGVPLSVRNSSDIAGVGTGSGNQFWNMVGDTSIAVTPFTNSATWFNKAAFTQPAAGTYGTQLRNTLRGPGYWIWDMGIRKNFRVREGQSLQFRYDLFNTLNHPNWGNPATDPTSGTFGTITGKTNDVRNMQLALKYIF